MIIDKPMEDFQDQFNKVINQSGTYTHISYIWGAKTEKKSRSLQTQLTRWLRQLPKTIETLVMLLDCLGYRLQIEPYRIKGNALTAYQTMFVDAIDATGLSRGQIGDKYGLATQTNPDAMRITLGRWLKETPQAIVELVLLLDCFDYRLLIEN